MKKPLLLLLCSLALVFLAFPAHSTVYYWDPEGTTTATTANLGVTWTSTGAQWSTTSAQTASPVALVSGYAVCFCAGTASITTPFTITLTNAVTIGGIFNGPLTPPGYFITISGAGGSLNLPAGLDAFDTGGSDGGTTTIAVPITGPGTVTLEGDDQIFLNALNTYTGGTWLGYTGNSFTSLVNFNNNASFGTGPISLITSGCAMVVESNLTLTITNAIIMTNGNLNIVGSTGGLTFSGPISLPASGVVTLGSGGTGELVTLSGVISGSGATLIKYNNSAMVLSGSNTYSGGTIISNTGTLSITHDYNLGATSGNLTIAGGTLYVSNSFQLSPSRSIIMNTNAVFGVSTGSIFTNSSPIQANSFPLTKSGAGTMILDATELYTGNTTVSGGTLVISLNGSILSPAISLAAGTTLDVSQIGGYDFDAAPNAQTLIAAGTGTSSTTAATLLVSQFGGATLGTASPLYLTFKPTSFRGDITHPSLTVSGGALTLNGGNIIVSNAATTALGPGTYTILTSGSSGSLDVASAPTITVVGTGIATNCTGTFQFVTNSLQLVVTIPPSNITGITSTNATNIAVSFAGLSGSSYKVQATTNLSPPVTWVNLSTNIAATNGAFNYVDTNAYKYPARFYRADY